jgi:hypothetical protein
VLDGDHTPTGEGAGEADDAWACGYDRCGGGGGEVDASVA